MFTNQLLAQNIDFGGFVSDVSGNKIMGANIVAVEKETQVLDGFGISNEDGYFRLILKSETDYEIKISFIGFKEVTFIFNEKDNIERNIVLEEQAEALDEVELVYEMPVTIKGDTIVYNADSFNTGSERKLEDVLKNLPGIEVNDEGRIEVEGKEVTKITVEGKDFFDGDSKLATQNLPANAVGKVEVLRNFSEVNQLRSVSNNEDNVAINISLKSGKDKFWFGEIGGGVGNDDRFIAAPKVFYYSKDLSMNLLLNSNNIGDPPLTRRDFYRFSGGFNNLNSRTGTSISISSDDAGITDLQNNRAKSIESQFGAYNFSYSPTEALQFSGFAIYSRAENHLEEKNTRTYNVSNEVEETSEVSVQETEQELFKFSAEYNPNEMLQTEYNVLYKTSSQDEVSDLTTISSRNGIRVPEQIGQLRQQTPFSLNQELRLYYTHRENHIFSLELQHLAQKDDPFYRAIKQFQPFGRVLSLNQDQENFNINQERNVQTDKVEGKLDYYFIISPKSNFNLTLGLTDVKQDFDSSIFQILDDNTTQNFSENNLVNRVNFHFQDAYAALHYRFITGIFTFDPGVTLHAYKTNTAQSSGVVSDAYSFFRPDFRVLMKLKESETIRLIYRSTRQFTDINNLAEGFIFRNYNSFFQGNPNLEAALFNAVNLNYQSINIFNFTNIFANLSYSRRDDAIQSTTSVQGINSVRSATNSNFPRDSYTASGRIDKRFKNFKGGLNVNFNYSDFNNVINNNPTESINFTQRYRVNIATNFRTKPNLEVGYTYNVRDYTNGDVKSRFFTNSPFARFDAYFLDGFIFEAEYTYNYYRNEVQTLNEYRFLEAELSYSKKGSKWEFGVSATNILNDTEINRDSFNQFSVTTNSYIIQPRYVVFKVQYDLTAIGGGVGSGKSKK
ncbi:MAG: TonB-dependent receptor [Flavobacteriales bacterium MED-G15]|nr:MAG: TonB-dependent receptor [Flavobacteriales bacterium MED-G15]|tara:strand:+ start:6016 stop:8712 length:2697 start_codon:yes stop_codon:yes gene_type:complete